MLVEEINSFILKVNTNVLSAGFETAVKECV